MKHLQRPNRSSAIILLAGLATVILVPRSALAQGGTIAQVLEEPNPLLFSGSLGYLGVLVGDVDNDSAQKLKLKEVRGAVITLIDHDAPAGQILKVNDVVLQLNGQPVEGAEQLRRMLREIPAGRNVSLLISRDGNELTVATQMGDQKKIEKSVWRKMSDGGDVFPNANAGNSLLTGDAPASGWHLPSLFSPTLHVGAMVEPLTSQMADYLGVSGGLMVKQVARKTQAEAAGLKAFDVIVKVGGDNIATTADWERALRSNQGKPVQLTILRDRKQQSLTLQVDSKHNKGELELEELFPDGECPQMAQLDEQKLIDGARVFADEMRQSAEAMRDSLKDLKIDPAQAEEMRKQADALRDEMKDFHIDQKQLDDWKNQMKDWQKNFNPGEFKLDQKQLDEWKRQMDEWRERFELGFGDADPQWI